MAIKSDKQRRAVMANLKKANKARLSSHYAAAGGPVTAAEGRRLQSERGRAGNMDDARKGRSVVRPGTKRSALWRGKPGRYDLAGVDDGGKPTKTPRSKPKASKPVAAKVTKAPAKAAKKVRVAGKKLGDSLRAAGKI